MSYLDSNDPMEANEAQVEERLLKDEERLPEVRSNQWREINWWHYCKPRKMRLAFRAEVTSHSRDEKGLITTPVISCKTCGIKGRFIDDIWVAE